MVDKKDKKILLLGSGYVAQPCADYIIRRPENKLTIASRTLANAQALAAKLPSDQILAAKQVNVNNDAELEQLVAQHDLTISLIPYTYHVKVIQAAIKHKKHVVTTSYVSDAMAALHEDAKKAGITVMNEIGLDPGIDHLYAVKTIDEVHKEGGKILSFISYCGGLPAPECSNNPLGYKFSWSSRGVLLALRNTAKFLESGKPVEIKGGSLMKSAKSIWTGYPAFAFVGYPNRDSTPYSERYGIPEAKDVLRGTLRYRGFPEFIQVLVELGLLSDEPVDYLAESDAEPVSWKRVTCTLVGVEYESVSDADLLKAVLKKAGADKLKEGDEQRQHIVLGMKWLGLLSDDAKVAKRGNYLDTLCATLEEKMKYGEGERDMIFLQHKFICENASGQKQTRLSTLVEYGVPGGYSAMAKTVGVPCGVAVQLILDGKLKEKGVLAPMSMAVCKPFITTLEKEGITMVEEIID